MDDTQKGILDDHYRHNYPELPTTEDNQLCWFLSRCRLYDPVVHSGAQTLVRLQIAHGKLNMCVSQCFQGPDRPYN